MIYSGMVEPEKNKAPEIKVAEFYSFEMLMMHCKEEYLDPKFDRDTDTYVLFDYDGTLVRGGVSKAAKLPFWSTVNRIVPKINEDTVAHLQETWDLSRGRVAVVTNRNSNAKKAWNSDELMAALRVSLDENGLGGIEIFEDMNRLLQFGGVLNIELADMINGNREKYQNLANWIKVRRSENAKVRIVMISDRDPLSLTEKPFLGRVARDFGMIEPTTEMELVHMKLLAGIF